FLFVERHLLVLCEAMGDRTDQELEQIYSTLRRRPDGRSLGLAHDFLWQTLAVLIGLFPISEAEYSAVVGQLEASTRSFGLRPVSRNYVGYVRSSFEAME